MKLQLFILFAFVLSCYIAQQCTDVPVAKCKPNPPIIELKLNETGEYQFTVADIDAGSTACEPIQYSLRNAPVNNVAICNTVDFVPPYALTVFLLVSSGAGTQSPAICATRYEVIDDLAPTAVCKQSITVGSNAAITADVVDGGSFDNCNIKYRVVNITSVGSCSEVVPVKLTVTDYSGNTASCETVVNVVDSIAPQAKCKNSTQNVGATGSITISNTQTNLIDNGSFDNCDGTEIDLQLSFPGGVTSLTRNCQSLGTTIVSLNAFDSAGNEGSCSSNIFFLDLTEPTAVCKQGLVYDVGTGFANITAKDLTGASTDACGISSYGSDFLADCSYLDVSYDRGYVGIPYTYEYTQFVTDTSFNEGYCSGTFQITDKVAPVALCKANVTIQVGDGYGTAYLTDVNAGSYDVCNPEYTLSFSLSQSTSFTCKDIANPRNLVLTVEDPFENVDTCTSFATFVDITPPEMDCQNILIDVGATPTGTFTLSPADGYLIDDGSFDVCTPITLGLNIARDLEVSCRNLGTREFLLYGTDSYGNQNFCDGYISFVDETKPAGVCADSVSVDIGDGEKHYFTSQFLMTNVTDVCGVSYTPLEHQFSCGQTAFGTIAVSSTATDPSGNSYTCSTDVIVTDLVAPNPECTLNIQFNVGAGPFTPVPTNIDNGSYDACTSVTLALVNSQNTFTCADIGTHDLTLQVTDKAPIPNVATCTAPVQVVDTTIPTPVCKDITIDVGSAPGGFVVLNSNDGSQSNGGSSDLCTASEDLEFTYLQAPITGSCATLGVRNAVLQVTDEYGNSATCNSKITFADLTKPEIACASVFILNVGRGPASPVLSHIVTASDTCGTITYSSATPGPFDCSDLGDQPITVRATDSAGNFAECTTTLRVVDTTDPDASCDGYNIVEVGTTGSATLTAAMVDFGSSDVCDMSPSLTLDKSSFTCADVGNRFVTLSVEDLDGNSDSCQSLVQVVDTVDPVAICKPITVNVGDTGSVTLTTEMGYLVDNGSNDVCSGVSLQLAGSYTGTCETVTPQTVTLKVKDDSGNENTCTSAVTFADLTEPTITCRSSITLDVGSDNVPFTQSLISSAALTYFDTCQDLGLAFTSNIATFTCDDIGATSGVEIIVTDSAGNDAYCFTTVIGEDHVGPEAKCKTTQMEIGSTGSVTVDIDDIDNGSTDLCDGYNMITYAINTTTITCASASRFTPGGFIPSGGVNVPVLLSLADSNNNPSSCVGNILITDTTPPVAKCLSSHTVYLDSTGVASITDKTIDNGSSDLCSDITYSSSPKTFTCSDVAAGVMVTLTVTDKAGITNTCQTLVKVVDNIRPVAKCADVITSAAGYVPTLTDINAGSSDNCGTPTYSGYVTSAFTNPIGGVTSLVVTDASGNVDTCYSQVTIQFGAALTISGLTGNDIAEHIPFVITFPGKTGHTLVNIGLINSKNSFYYSIAKNAQYSRGQYVVSGGISGVTPDQDYLVVLSDASTGVNFASKAIHLIRYPTNHP